MKPVTAIILWWFGGLIIIGLVGCAHETTTMDRELALELAKREPIVMAAAAPIINVNVNGGGGQAATSEYETHVSSRNGCGVFPIYGANRVVIRYEEVCYGSGY